MDLGFREPEADLREGSEKGQMLCSKVTWMFLLHPQSSIILWILLKNGTNPLRSCTERAH